MADIASPKVDDAERPAPRAYTIRQAQAVLGGISRAAIYAMHRRGQVRFARAAGRILIPVADIARLLGEGGE
ncbi:MULTISPECIES: helix-turn-helix domain-containing protein [unclassified Chelatococcus]|uniref:helix-turn-helix domain-containing protein n=1 Tax=unclassified Chelatococcus TaxID=2638111 RepID=UPI00037C328B|nr:MULTISPECIES: helix-turn-helix domain-containing protein [unclassified Chelatococcus]ALA17177.1 hypothetical protein AL346_06870 [Chelatococcus sp. CO-6]